MLRGILAIVIFAPLTAFCGVWATLLCLTGRTWGTMYVGRIWSGAMARVVGARIRYEDPGRATAHSPCIYLANHQSSLDIWALMKILPLETRFVAKHSLFRMPFLGWAMRAAEFISVDRSDRERAIESLRLAAEKIRSGSSVVLFAEGTRSRDGRLQPFKKGPFHLAFQAEVPVVPVLIEGSGKVVPPGSPRAFPGEVRVRFLEPILPELFRGANPQRLRHETYRRMVAAIEDPDALPLEVDESIDGTV